MRLMMLHQQSIQRIENRNIWKRRIDISFNVLEFEIHTKNI
jgi:hypothetical protein